MTRLAAAVAPFGVSVGSGLLSLSVAVVIVAALHFAREVLIPITVAVILSFMLAPLVSRLRRWRLPHAAAVLVALGIVGVIGGVIGTQVIGIERDLP